MEWKRISLLKQHEADDSDMIRATSRLCAALIDEGKIDETERTLRQCLLMEKSMLSGQHPCTLVTISNLGVALLGQDNKMDEAIDLLQSFVSFHRKAYGEGDPRTQSNMSN